MSREGGPERFNQAVWVADWGVVLRMRAKVSSQSEGRPRQVDHTGDVGASQTQGWSPCVPGLIRVHEAAKRDRRARLTALLHHVDESALYRAFTRLRRSAASGVDGLTVDAYREGLMDRLRDLHDRIQSGRYRSQRIRRTTIPKPDGGERTLGIVALEDKIVQGAVAEVLNAVYEVEFLDMSHGFRPRRNAQGALAQLEKSVMTERVNWVLDADIKQFFDSVDHEWLLRMLEHRIGDRRLLRLIEQWLKVGVGNATHTQTMAQGTPQGAGISPLLANVFLHYALDLWVEQWRHRYARGAMRAVRYADDVVFTFQYQADAEAFQQALDDRLARFGLALHESKTRLIAFGNQRMLQSYHRGESRPETFNFLGFTHYNGFTRRGRVTLFRRTQKERQRAKLKELRQQMRRRMHRPLAEQHAWLCAVLKGHYQYFGVPGNYRMLERFLLEVTRYWRYVLMRRNDRRSMPWARFQFILAQFPLPRPRIAGSWTRAAMAS